MLKDNVKQMIDQLPEDCSIEDIQYTLYVRSKIQKGLDDIVQGNMLSSEEIKVRMNKWFRK